MSIPEEKKEPKFFLYCHLFNDSEKGVIQSVKFEIIPEVKTILDFKGKLSKHLETTFKSQNIKYTPLNVCKTLDSPSLNDTSKIRMYFENLEDIYVKVSTEVIPIQTTNVDVNKDIVLSYKTLTKYSFYESSQKYVRVLIPVPGIEKVEKKNIIATFEEESLEVKINKALNNNNYRFAVPKLYCKIKPDECDTLIKGENLILKLRKGRDTDVWTYLFNQ
jgi:hypothetical protein